MAVHNKLGPGLKEVTYHKALSAALLEEGLSFEEEKPVEIFMDGTSVGLLYLDHLVENSVAVKIKALSYMMTDEEVAQVITYLAATGLSGGCSSTSIEINYNTSGSYRQGNSISGMIDHALCLDTIAPMSHPFIRTLSVDE